MTCSVVWVTGGRRSVLAPLAAYSIGLAVAFLTLASVGVYLVLGLFWTIPSAYLDAGAAGRRIALIGPVGSFISSVGSLRGVVSPFSVGWIKVHTGSIYAAL